MNPCSAASLRAWAAASARLSPCSTTLAPQARVRVTFVDGVKRGMTMVLPMPSRLACRATACAWFPADMVTTPAARSASDSIASRLAAPRSLKEPIACRFSSLSATWAPVALLTASDARVGVRRTRPSIRRAAASMSAKPMDWRLDPSGGWVSRPERAGSGNRVYPYLTPRISYDRSPPGAGTETVSPTALPISALASGEEMLSSDCLMSASYTPTIW